MAANFLFAEKYYVYQKTKMMMEVNRQIHEQVESKGRDISLAIRDIAMDNSLEILLADDNFNLIFSNHAMGPPMDPRIMDIIFDFKKYPKEYYETDKPTIIKTDMKNGDRIRLLSKIVQGDHTYYLVIRLSVKSISADMKSTNLFVLYISSFAILIGSLIVYFIAKHFSKPIEDINTVAVRISNLDFSHRSKDVKRKDEIGSLARNINTMSDCLEDNILSLKEANKKLEIDNKYMSEVDEQRKELIANISHELKTPLAILTGYTEMLSNDIPGIDKAFYFETIQDETRKMDVLIKNLLNLSDFENRLFHLNLQEIDLEKLTERIYQKNKLLMDNKGIVSEFHPMQAYMPSSIASITVLADPMYLEVALNNYIANAISYTDKGFRIIIKAEKIEDEVVISVFNEGSGINEEHMDKIWNSFYREDKSRKRTSQNNIGLGLYIVRSIMNAHHGKCGVCNKDNGVEFWLSLKVIS
jgi:signal transduction histidine kinase